MRRRRDERRDERRTRGDENRYKSDERRRPRSGDRYRKYYYQLGLQVSKDLPVNYDCSEIAAKLGITPAGAQQLSLVALGKLICRLREMEEI